MATTAPASIAELQSRLLDNAYVADRGLAISLFLALRLRRPLFLEGEAGVGKTALAAAIAGVLDRDLIRLQCYEGLEVSHALYEWDYARQLLELRILEASENFNADQARHALYSERFLIRRPLLQAIDPARTRPAVLLIDEIDRADQAFVGFLLDQRAKRQRSVRVRECRSRQRSRVDLLTSHRRRALSDPCRPASLPQSVASPAPEPVPSLLSPLAVISRRGLGPHLTAG